MDTFSCDGVILKVALLNDFDAQVTVFTRRFGKLNLIARRLNSRGRLQGSIFAMTLCRFGLRHLPKSPTLGIEECERRLWLPNLASNLLRFICASYICELLLSAVPDQSPSPDLYELLIAALDSINSTPSPEAVTLAVELQMLKSLGFEPSFSQCVECNRPQTDGSRLFLVEAGGVICRDCLSKRKPGPESRSVLNVSSGLIAFAKMALRKPVASLRMTRISMPLAQELLRLLRLYKMYHLQTRLNSARLLDTCLSRSFKR